MDEKTLRVLEYQRVLEMLADHCSFSFSKQLARSLRPKTSLQFVKGLLSETTEAAEFLNRSGEPPFGAVTDVRAAVSRARIGGSLSGAELLAISDTLRCGARYKRAILEAKDDYPILESIASSVADLADLRATLEKSIGEDGDVLDTASPRLASIRKDISVISNRVRDRMEALIRDKNIAEYLQESIITVRNDRFVVPVKKEHKNSVRGIVHDQSSSGATLFVEPLHVVELNNRLVELRSRELEEIDEILRSLSQEVASVADDIEGNVDSLARLDLIFAKGRLSRRMRAVEPMLSDRGVVDLRNARHPLLTGEVVPVSPRVGDEFTTLVITGPNTGGKTVTLKVIGLLCLMAQTGLHVPADEGSVVSVFDAIFADIGDEQSIEQSLSTFSSHMTQIVNILENATSNSLVLLDELGAGTDPTEGAALAMAILKYLHSKGARTVATTHYGQLKAFTHEAEGFENASMEFDLNTLRPTYRLNIGLPGSSNALAIAERLGLKSEVIEDARSRLGQQDASVESLIEAVHQKNLEFDKKLESVRATERELKRMKAEFDRVRHEFEKEREALLSAARKNAEMALDKARREAESLLRQLRDVLEEGKKSGLTHDVVAAIAGETRQTLRDLSEHLREDSEVENAREYEPGEEVREGQVVYLHEYKQTGIVLESRTGSNTVVVQIGAMRVSVDRSKLRKVEDGAAAVRSRHRRDDSSRTQPQSRHAKPSGSVATDVRMEIDLRGMTVDDALIEVDRYLDSAV
ncbi:MAG: endonuclease MutS2, partial [Bacillota bacterium]